MSVSGGKLGDSGAAAEPLPAGPNKNDQGKTGDGAKQELKADTRCLPAHFPALQGSGRFNCGSLMASVGQPLEGSGGFKVAAIPRLLH